MTKSRLSRGAKIYEKKMVFEIGVWMKFGMSLLKISLEGDQTLPNLLKTNSSKVPNDFGKNI